MKPWNPHAMTFHGQPITGQTPPKLVVYGPPLTAQQGAMLQSAYAAFADSARVSIVPNPCTRGRLVDGSPYTIECVQGGCTCTVWTSELDSKENTRRSGVVLSICDLDGSLIAEHSKDGAPIAYLFTPKVEKGTRIPTGDWLVRRLVPPDGGGKAVNTWTDGLKYFAGVNAQADAAFPFSPTAYGAINDRAYVSELYDNLAVYRNGKDVGVSLDNQSPLPFVFTDDDGKPKSAQIIIRRDPYASPVEYHADLYMGDLDDAPGEFVTTMAFPAGLAPRPFTFSFRPDGTKARFIAGKEGRLHKCTLHIGASTLTYSSDWISPAPGTTETWNFEAPSDTNCNSMQWKGDQYVSAPISTSYLYIERADDVGTGVYSSSSNAAWAVYAYGPRGQEYSADSAGTSSTTHTHSAYSFRDTTYVYNPPPDYGIYSTTNVVTHTASLTREYNGGEDVDSNFIDLMRSAGIGADIDFQYAESVDVTTTWTVDGGAPGGRRLTIDNASGSGYQITPNGYGSGKVSPLFFDRYLEFAVGLVYGGGVRTEEWEHQWTIGAHPSTGEDVLNHQVNSTKDETTPLSYKLVVADRHGVLLNRSFDITTRRHLVFAASDPMTGAVVVNIIEVDSASRNNRHASWVFLVTDASTKELADVLPSVPANARAVSNASLYTL